MTAVYVAIGVAVFGIAWRWFCLSILSEVEAERMELKDAPTGRWL